MKQCPRCHAVVRDDYECPFCYETLTYEMPVMQDKEYIPFNRYTVLSYLKTVWFPLVSLIICVVRILTLPRPEGSFFTVSRLAPISSIFAIWLLSLVAALLSRNPRGWHSRYFTEEQLQMSCGITSYFCGTLAPLLAFVLFL